MLLTLHNGRQSHYREAGKFGCDGIDDGILIFKSLLDRQCTNQLQIMQGRNEELMLPNKEEVPHSLSICDLQDKLSSGKGL